MVTFSMHLINSNGTACGAKWLNKCWVISCFVWTNDYKEERPRLIRAFIHDADDDGDHDDDDADDNDETDYGEDDDGSNYYHDAQDDDADDDEGGK